MNQEQNSGVGSHTAPAVQGADHIPSAPMQPDSSVPLAQPAYGYPDAPLTQPPFPYGYPPMAPPAY
eukprot:2529085-Pyramimonas_sp.AAC.1